VNSAKKSPPVSSVMRRQLFGKYRTRLCGISTHVSWSGIRIWLSVSASSTR
jgi:hypothetical protein